MRKFLCASVLAFTLAGCQTSYETPYQNGQGTTAEQMTGNIYRVTSVGNQFTDPLRVVDYLLVKSAETALAAGFSHFQIVAANDMSRASVNATPGMFIGDIYMPPSYSVASMPGATIMIEVGNFMGAKLPQGVYSADEVMAVIAPRVKAPPKKAAAK